MRYLLFGATGQAGHEFCIRLLSEGHYVMAVCRNLGSGEHLLHNLKAAGVSTEYLELFPCDATKKKDVEDLIRSTMPTYIGNLAASSSIALSFQLPHDVIQNNSTITLNILEAIRSIQTYFTYNPVFWEMSSLEIFGNNYTSNHADYTFGGHHFVVGGFGPLSQYPQNCFVCEDTPMQAISPYGAGKIMSRQLVSMYRDLYGINAKTIICSNFEGPYRKDGFVSKKICRYVARLSRNYIVGKLQLGSLDARRCWLAASDMVDGVLLAISKEPSDFIISGERSISVEDFCKEAFKTIGVDNMYDYINIDDSLMRPSEMIPVTPNCHKIKKAGWKQKISFEQMVKDMINFEVQKC